MDYNMISSMKVDELKGYLRLRGLKVSGRRIELVARVFAAAENNVPILKSAQEIECDLREEYLKKLVFDNITLPDPFLIDSGWMSEEEARVLFPMVLYPEVYHFLKFYPAELGSDDLSDYKTSKAHAYFKDGWLQELMYNDIDNKCEYCLVRGSCRKSEKINDPFHKFWIALEKKSGKIIRGHCTCMAGMGQTCNHVAAALFRIEAMVRLGLTNPSCTSKPNEWLPAKGDVKPTKIKDIDFSRTNFGQGGRQKSKRPLNSTPKKMFNPISGNNIKLLNLNEISKALEIVSPNSIVHTAIALEEVDFAVSAVTDITSFDDKKIQSVSDLIKEASDKNAFEILLKERITPSNILEIEKITRGQSDNTLWYAFRKGVVTASKCHDIITKMEKVSHGKCGSVDFFNVNQRVSGLTYVDPNIPALKYGRTMENEAAQSFFEKMKSTHKNFQMLECGLFLDKFAPIIGASPDRIIHCDCCPSACLEIKCPISINHASPDDENVSLPYLDSKKKLKRNHKYFTQCIIQMGVTELNATHFMVWTPHGFIIEIIKFDSKIWNEMRRDILNYYNQFYLNSIFYDL